MKRLLIVAAGVALLSAFVPTSAGAGESIAGTVWLVHGLGDSAGNNPADVYQRPTGSGEQFSLLVEGDADGFEYGAIEDTGSANVGDYDILVCTAAVAPLDNIDDCEDNSQNALNSNAGNVITMPEAEQVTIFLGYGPSTRAEAIVFVPDLTCIDGSTNGRATAAHAADADPVTVSVAGTPIIEDLANSEQEALDVPAATYEVNVSDAALLNLDASLDVTAVQNTMAFVTGDPDEEEDYTIITQRFDLEACEVPTTPSTAPEVQQQTQPRFTG